LKRKKVIAKGLTCLNELILEGKTMANSKKSTFESQLEELEGVVNRLEAGDLSLDDSLTQFEAGVKLTKDCQKMLNEAQQKVQILSDNEQKLETFD